VDPEQLKRDVAFNVNDLDSAMMEHASLFVHYAEQAARARRQYERMKSTLEILESKLYALHRTKLMQEAADEAAQKEGKDKGKVDKVTEAQVTAAMKNDQRWWAAQQKLIDARMAYDLANDARAAFEQRKDMMVQIAVDRRTEREGQLRIQGAQAQREAVIRAMQK